VDIRLAALLGIPGALSSMIGVEVLLSFNDTWLRRGLGILLICTFVLLIVKKRLAKQEKFCGYLTVEDLLTPSGKVQIFSVSVIGGILFGLFSIGGPPVMIWAAIKGVPKDMCRANVSASEAIMLPVNVVYLLFIRKEYQNDYLPCYLVFVGGCSVGLLLGNIAAKYVSEKRFQLLLTYVILLTGGLFISTGMPIIFQSLVVFICVCIGVIFGILMLRGKRESSSEEGAMDVHIITSAEPEMATSAGAYDVFALDPERKNSVLYQINRINI